MFSFVRDTAFCYVLANLISPSVFPFSASLCLSRALHLSSSPLVLPWLSVSLFDAHTHTNRVKLRLLWLGLLFGLSLRSPPLRSLLFSVCFVALCTEAEMQIECRQFVVGEQHSYAPPVALELNTSVCPHDQLKTTQDLLIYDLHPLCLGNLNTLHDLIQCQDALFAGNQHALSTNH